MTQVASFLESAAAQTKAYLEDYLDRWGSVAPALDEAVRYSLFAGGKRFRPALVLAATEASGGDRLRAMPVAAAFEMVHTYSLIHDDLPAMDDDDLRRGHPTSHKVFGEAMAILAGDALLTMAFAVITESGDLALVSELASAAGVAGMVGGQVLDIAQESSGANLESLQAIHRAKTGALIRAAVRSGGIVSVASENALDALTAYGEHVGLAFQIADDILDVSGDETALGKPVGSDASRNQVTYASLVGVERARELALEARDAAVDALAPFGERAAMLAALAHYVVDRNL